MRLDDYQQETRRTCLDEPGFTLSPSDTMLSWNALGLAGEAGEVCDLIKKGIYHAHDLDHDKLKKELGDVLWYVAALSSGLGLTLSEVAEANIAKLRERYPEGYSSERSKARGSA